MSRYPSGLHHPVAVYAKQVVSGRLREQCCPAEIAACQRHLNDLKRQGAKDFPYVFDCTRADRVYRFVEMCIQVRGVYARKPIMLQPWQKFDIGCLYGWVHKDTGARRFNRSLNKRGRGNVKSTENSCKCLYHMNSDVVYPPYHPEQAVFEAEPEVECAAVDRDQAKRVYGDALKIAQATPQIGKRMILPKAKAASSRKWGGMMRPLSKDTRNKDGGAPSYFCLDEYEAHETSAIRDLGLNGFGKRAQPLLDCIMTAGENSGSRPAKAEEDYARRVVFGELRDEEYFVMLRELPPEANPHDRKTWLFANPVLREDNEYSRTLLRQIETEYNEAYNSGDAEKIRKFLTRRMCQWQAAHKESYLNEEQIKLAKLAMVEPDEFDRLVHGLPAWAGFDLGKRIDLTGVAMVVPLPDGRIALAVHGFMPLEGARRHEITDKVPYLDWSKRGFCTLTEGSVTDNRYAYDWICAREQRHDLELLEIDYDGHNATDLAISICEDRHNEDFCVEIRQTCSGQTLAVKTFREMLLQGKIVLEHSPLLLWCLRNACVHENYYGDIKLSKYNKDDSQRIDPLAAAMNALARALVRENKSNLSWAVGQEDYEM